MELFKHLLYLSARSLQELVPHATGMDNAGENLAPVCFLLKQQVDCLAAIIAGIANEDLTVTGSCREEYPLFIAFQRIYIAMGKGATLMCGSWGLAWQESQTSAGLRSSSEAWEK